MTKRITKMFRARKKLGWTQVRLAETLGVTQPRISVWESGLVDIPELRRKQIGKALGVDPDELTDEWQ